MSSPAFTTLYSIVYSVLFVNTTLACFSDHDGLPIFIFPCSNVNSFVVTSNVPSPSFPTVSFVVTFMLYVVCAFNPVNV